MPFSTYVWSAILKSLYQMHISKSKIDENINWNMRLEGMPDLKNYNNDNNNRHLF